MKPKIRVNETETLFKKNHKTNPSFPTNPMMITPEFLNSLEALIVETGNFILTEQKTFSADKIEYKGKNDMVSYVDKTAEKMLVKGCKTLIPNAGFINEESGESISESEYRWIIDPLDGTTNFIHDLPCFAISLALQYKEKTILGYVYHIPNREMFFAQKGKGATLNGEPIRVSAASQLSEALLATGFPYTQFGWIEEYMDMLKALMPRSHGLRRMGSAAIDLAYVACGRFGGFFEVKLSVWDVAAGALLVQEAGGTVTDFTGGDGYLFGREIVATNGKFHAEIIEITQEKKDLYQQRKEMS